jgi:hypothetical protein
VHEVDLCDATGALNEDAKGWSRRPLHSANLRGHWGRNKRWDYWAILGDGFVAAITYANVDYLGIAEVWWADLRTGEEGGRAISTPLGRGIRLPDLPGTSPLRFDRQPLRLDLSDDETATYLKASWTDRSGERGALNAVVAKSSEIDSLNVVIPWDTNRFQYTSKHQARPALGSLKVGRRVFEFGSEASPAWGVLDVGRGRWPYRTAWNWGGGAGLDTAGNTVGLQLGGKWTEGTGFTENGVFINGRLTKIGQELQWDYQWEEPLAPWTVRSADDALALQLTPTFDRHAKVEAFVLGTEVHQVFGRWQGHVTADDGTRYEVADLAGFAEESRSRW